MATYFHGSSEIQADTLQTLYLMNPNYVAYSDTQHHQQQQQPPANMFFLNSAAGNPLNTSSISHAPPHQNQHFVGIPLPTVGSNNSDDHNRPSVHEIPALHGMVPRFHYNLWGNVDQTTAGATVASNSGDVLSQLGFRRPAVAVPMSPTTTHQPQGLSLSLNSSQNLAYRSLAGEHDISGQPPLASGGEDVRRSGGSPSSVSNGISSLQSVILGSKYLKAAQQVLDEVVNVGKEINSDTGEGTKEKAKMKRESMAVNSGGDGESSGKNVAEPTAAQRQELQMKKAKLVNMLDEVEQRYRQYHHQMQIVVSSFEQAAGIGSAKSYTALALQTISKQFRCLKDVITGQIKTTSKSLGEDDGSGGKAEGSRLKFVDQQLRQQRALQQLGMIQVQHNAWRPQRGLPERAVSVLRAWLFEHFLHPYPKDSDKHMLAKQTGLSRGQVSNWFINARVRLWKPMVEEMYMEEMKDQEQNVSENNMTKTEPNKDSSSKSTALEENTSFFQNDQTKQERPINQNTSPTEISTLTASTPPFGGSIQPQTGFTTLMRSSDMEGIVHRSPKKPKSSDKLHSPSSILSMEMDMKPRGETDKGIKDSYLFGTYPIGEIERFDHEQLATTRYHSHGSGFSLTLGLPHCETHQQNYLSNNQNIQLGRRLNMGAVESHYSSMIDPQQPQPSHSNTRYESMNIHDRKRFAAQLLPDFVA